MEAFQPASKYRKYSNNWLWLLLYRICYYYLPLLDCLTELRQEVKEIGTKPTPQDLPLTGLFFLRQVWFKVSKETLALSVCYAECRGMCHWAEPAWEITTQISSNWKAFEYFRHIVEHWAHSRAGKPSSASFMCTKHQHSKQGESQHTEILILQWVLKIKHSSYQVLRTEYMAKEQ